MIGWKNAIWLVVAVCLACAASAQSHASEDTGFDLEALTGCLVREAISEWGLLRIGKRPEFCSIPTQFDHPVTARISDSGSAGTGLMASTIDTLPFWDTDADIMLKRINVGDHKNKEDTGIFFKVLANFPNSAKRGFRENRSTKFVRNFGILRWYLWIDYHSSGIHKEFVKIRCNKNKEGYLCVVHYDLGKKHFDKIVSHFRVFISFPEEMLADWSRLNKAMKKFVDSFDSSSVKCDLNIYACRTK